MRYMLAPYGCGRIHLSMRVFFLDKKNSDLQN